MLMSRPLPLISTNGWSRLHAGPGEKPGGRPLRTIPWDESVNPGWDVPSMLTVLVIAGSATGQGDGLVPAAAEVELDHVRRRVRVNVVDRLAERLLPHRQPSGPIQVAGGIDDEGGEQRTLLHHLQGWVDGARASPAEVKRCGTIGMAFVTSGEASGAWGFSWVEGTDVGGDPPGAGGPTAAGRGVAASAWGDQRPRRAPEPRDQSGSFA